MGPIHPVWALAAIHPRWWNRYGIGKRTKVKSAKARREPERARGLAEC